MKTIDVDNIKTGDIVLTQGRSFLSKLIQRFQTRKHELGRYSHSGVAWWGFGTLYLVEAQKEGIVITPFIRHYVDSKKFESVLVLRAEEYVDGSEIGRIMMQYVGRVRYDFLNLLIHQPVQILTGGWVGANKQRKKRFVCHEFSAHVHNRYFKRLIFPNETRVNGVDIVTNEFYEHYLLF
jgi:hypothetical protein